MKSLMLMMTGLLVLFTPAVFCIDAGVNDGHPQDASAVQECDCLPGRPRGINTVNLLEVIFMINYLYMSGPAPVPYTLCSGDPDGNCAVNILDITYLISYIYKGGPAPVTCEEWVDACGLPLRN